MMHSRSSRILAGTSLSLAVLASGSLRGSDALTEAGDILQFALPAIGGAATLFEGDPEFEGTWQWAKTHGVMLGTVTGIKLVVDKTRPSNGGGSFPSGHTAGAFAGAAFIERRYGWGWGTPAYALAALTGYSRIEADAHDFWDVIGGAAVGTMSAYIFTEPFEVAGRHVSIRPDLEQDYYGLKFSLLSDEEAYAARVSGQSNRRKSFASWLSRGSDWEARNRQTWTGTDPTETVSGYEFRMEFYDQSLNANRNTTKVTAYAPKLRGNWAFRDNMMIGAEMGYVWNNQFPFDSNGFSDLEVNYLWRFYDEEKAGPWCSRAGAFGVDLLAPTGDASKGTGSDSWMIRPKITGAWSPIAGTNIYPTLSYYQSWDNDSVFGGETSVAAIDLQMEYKFQNGVYAYWKPEFLWNFSSSVFEDDFVANHVFEIGTPLGDAGVLFARYELISNSLYKIVPPPSGRRPRFYDDVVSCGFRGRF